MTIEAACRDSCYDIARITRLLPTSCATCRIFARPPRLPAGVPPGDACPANVGCQPGYCPGIEYMLCLGSAGGQAMSRADLIIFDCDGVLVDSEVLSCGCLSAVLAGH